MDETFTPEYLGDTLEYGEDTPECLGDTSRVCKTWRFLGCVKIFMPVVSGSLKNNKSVAVVCVPG